jgi:glyoxylase-like metal-dependent hydrolase (beta-lactamase superfamily II)
VANPTGGSQMTDPGWFAVQRLPESVYLISEPMHVNSYLILGSHRAVLFDSGMGIGNIRATVEGITRLPVLVVNSHHHFDHVGGNHLFDDIAIHGLGAGPLRQGPPASWTTQYLEFAATMFEQYLKFRAIDQEWFQVLAPQMQMRSLPDDVRAGTWQTVTSVATRLLGDGDRLALGDRDLTVVHTPGHSPDSICLLDESRRLLFAGDTINTGPLYAHFGESDVDSFAASVTRLASEVAPRIDLVYGAHGARYQSYREHVGVVARAFDRLRAGGTPLTDTTDCFGEKAREASFNDFSIVVPWEFGRSGDE